MKVIHRMDLVKDASCWTILALVWFSMEYLQLNVVVFAIRLLSECHCRNNVWEIAYHSGRSQNGAEIKNKVEE